MMGELTSEILGNMGYKDVQLNTVFHQYMAAFPPSQDRADELIRNSAITAGRSGATRMIGKTPVEAFRIPTLTDNITGIELINSGLATAAECYVDEERIAEECAVIRREVESIFESIIIAGHGAGSGDWLPKGIHRHSVLAECAQSRRGDDDARRGRRSAFSVCW
jgi:methylaspartate mutase epsilon subunit